MKAILCKEIRLASSPLTRWFLAAALLTFVPGYPILLSAFFITLGIFYSFQATRENNDIGYSMLLPVAKSQIVRGKFSFVFLTEACGFLAMTVFTLLRMTLLRNATVYTANALMCANLSFLGFVLLIFGLFNFLFVRGFFRTAYYFGKPFITYCVVAMLVIAAAETLPHLPGLGALNAFGFAPLTAQGIALLLGAAAFVLLSAAAVVGSVRRFEKLDL